MNLKQWQEKFGVKRIDFAMVKPSGLDYQCGTDAMVCPYCNAEFEYESEETESILRGEAYQCPECNKWFYVDADVTIDTYCYPMEETILQHKRYIQDTYDYVDKCEALGTDWPDTRYGLVEWSVYDEYARPYFENQEEDQDKEAQNGDH